MQGYEIPGETEEFNDMKLFTTGFNPNFNYDAINAGKLDLSELDIEIDIANIDQYPNEEYALLRKNGLGTSDSSIVLGVNPYKTKQDLVEEKCRDYLTDEEMEVGDKSSVRKGRDLEPMIIFKHSQVMERRVIKPVDMYYHKDYPYIKFNFDGVVDKLYNEDGTYQYIPDEIKVCTTFGQKHYQPQKATFQEGKGWDIIPPHYEEENVGIEQKAAMYGIPPYYYTQLQQQILGLNAPYGFLTVMFERDWLIRSWFVWRDQKVINQIIMETTKLWNIIQEKRSPNFNLGVEIKEEEAE